MTWISARKVASVVATLLIGAVVAFVLLNRGAATGPAQDETGASGVPQQGQAGRTGQTGQTGEPREPRALVDRILDGLGEGRSARSFDNPATGAAVPVVESASNVPLGELEVPAMGLRTPFREGVHDAVINKGPGHWPGTPLPGQAGNSVISGHRATHGAEFVDLDDLRPGDPIRVLIGGQDRPITYRVQGTTVVKESRYVDYVTQQPANDEARVLTLFACTPVWDSTHRIVVRAEASPAPAEAG